MAIRKHWHLYLNGKCRQFLLQKGHFRLTSNYLFLSMWKFWKLLGVYMPANGITCINTNWFSSKYKTNKHLKKHKKHTINVYVDASPTNCNHKCVGIICMIAPSSCKKENTMYHNVYKTILILLRVFEVQCRKYMGKSSQL